MGKDKYRRFQENLTFDNMVQPAFEEIFGRDHKLKGRWREQFFGNDRPIVLELGCGRGEYTVAMACAHPEVNFIGIDIKGARMWRGAKTATEENLNNAAFLRTRIEFICSFFGQGEVDEIWITFPDPQLKKQRAKKRLTSPVFLEYYSRFLKADGLIHLKTDSLHLHEYTKSTARDNSLTVHYSNSDIYSSELENENLAIHTAYEELFLGRGLPITYIRFSLGERSEFTAADFQEEPDLDRGRTARRPPIED